MDLSIVLTALSNVFSFSCLLALSVGVIWGIVAGALPGMGSVIAITICLPFTYSMHQIDAISLLLGVYCGSVYGGCISSILINTPGTPQSAATCFDGYPLAQQGKAGLALGWATLASAFGGIFSCIILIITGPQLAKFALQFGPIETVGLIIMALTCIACLSRENMLKGLLAGVLGLFLASVGPDPFLGEVRFDFGFFLLSSGFDLIAVVVGIFALAEVLSRASQSGDEKPPLVTYDRMEFPHLHEITTRSKLFIKSSLIGTGVGILPGAGATAAAFISYGEAKRSSPNSARMGHGEPDGIIAPEAANNAVTGGALVPTLALGLPGDAVTAIMLGTLVLHGITPGVRLMVDNPEVVYGTFISLFLANLIMVGGGILVARVFAKILRIPEPLLMGGIILLCLLGSYGVRGNVFDLYVTFAMGIVGFFLRYTAVNAAPMVIGLVLGNQLELGIRQGLVLTYGSFYEFLTFSVIASVLFLISFLIIAVQLYQTIKDHKRS